MEGLRWRFLFLGCGPAAHSWGSEPVQRRLTLAAVKEGICKIAARLQKAAVQPDGLATFVDSPGEPARVEEEVGEGGDSPRQEGLHEEGAGEYGLSRAERAYTPWGGTSGVSPAPLPPLESNGTSPDR